MLGRQPKILWQVMTKGDSPVTLDEVKNHLRLDLSDTSEDVLLDLYILAINEKVKGLIWWRITRDVIIGRGNIFPDCDIPINIDEAPVITINKVEFLDDDFDKNNYTEIVDFSVQGANIHPEEGEIWPQKTGRLNLIQITATIGCGDDLPPDIRLAILNGVAFMYRNRGDCKSSSELDSLLKSLLQDRLPHLLVVPATLNSR